MKRSAAAFTLIEVLIALLIIAIALAAAIRATNESIRATIHVRNSVTAHWVGLNILSQMQTGIMSAPKSGNQLYGKTDMLNQQWKWTAETDLSSQLNNIERITVTVNLKNKRITSVTGYVE